MLAFALRAKLRASSAPSRSRWGVVIGGAIAVLAVPWMLETISFEAQERRIASNEARIRDRMKALCVNFTVVDWRARECQRHIRHFGARAASFHVTACPKVSGRATMCDKSVPRFEMSREK